jgi:hypothetical protein
VLEQREFIVYTEEVGSVIGNNGLDIIRLLTTCNCTAAAHQMQRRRVSCCAQNVTASCGSCRLELDGDVSQIAWFGSHANMKNISS